MKDGWHWLHYSMLQMIQRRKKDWLLLSHPIISTVNNAHNVEHTVDSHQQRNEAYILYAACRRWMFVEWIHVIKKFYIYP